MGCVQVKGSEPEARFPMLEEAQGGGLEGPRAPTAALRKRKASPDMSDSTKSPPEQDMLSCPSYDSSGLDKSRLPSATSSATTLPVARRLTSSTSTSPCSSMVYSLPDLDDSGDSSRDVVPQLASIGDLDGQCEKMLVDITGMLMGMPGGCAVVALDPRKGKLPFNSLDDGLLKTCFQVELGRHGVRERPDRFEALLRAFCTPTASDRWELPAVARLAETLGYRSLPDAPHLQALVHPTAQPKDGAIVISLAGTVLGACARLRGMPTPGRQSLRFMCRDGTRAGTRHAAALETAQWLGEQGIGGAVITRSDSGSVHFFKPQPQRPEVMEVAAPSAPTAASSPERGRTAERLRAPRARSPGRSEARVGKARSLPTQSPLSAVSEEARSGSEGLGELLDGWREILRRGRADDKDDADADHRLRSERRSRTSL